MPCAFSVKVTKFFPGNVLSYRKTSFGRLIVNARFRYAVNTFEDYSLLISRGKSSRVNVTYVSFLSIDQRCREWYRIRRQSFSFTHVFYHFRITHLPTVSANLDISAVTNIDRSKSAVAVKLESTSSHAVEQPVQLCQAKYYRAGRLRGGWTSVDSW